MVAIDSFITKLNRVNWHGLMSRFVSSCGLSWQDISDKHDLPYFDNSFGYNASDELSKIEFTRWEDVLHEVETAVLLRNDNIGEIKSYFINILSQLKYVSSFFYKSTDSNDSLLQELTSYVLNCFPYTKDLPEFIKKFLIERVGMTYSGICSPNCLKADSFEDNELQDTEEIKQIKNRAYQKQAHQFYSSICKIRQDDCFHVLYQISSDLKQFAVYIESVLLENGISLDFLTIQDESNIHIVDNITIEDISIFRQWPVEKTRTLAKNSVIIDSQDKENVDGDVQGKNSDNELLDFPLGMLRAKGYTSFSFNLVDSCGEYEIDRLFFQILKRQEGYDDKMFNSDCKTFKDKCISKATGEEGEAVKEAWIVAILGVLSEIYYFFNKVDDVLCSRAISFWAILEASFLKAPHQICVKHLAHDLELDDILDAVKENDCDTSYRDSSISPMTVIESALYEELGPLLIYQERRICKGCNIKDCLYRFGNIKYFGDVNYDNDGVSSNQIKEENTYSFTNRIINRLSSSETSSYIESILALFGIHPYNTKRTTDYFQDEWDKFITQNHTGFTYESYSDWEAVTKEIRHNVKTKASVECELESYIFSLLSPLEDTCAILFPEDDDHRRVRGAQMLHLFMEISCYSPDEFKTLWRNSEKIIKEQGNKKWKTYIEFILSVEEQARDSYYEEKESRNSKHRNSMYSHEDASMLYRIVDDLNTLACIIEGSLLENGLQYDIYYFQNASGVILSNHVDEIGVSSYMDWTTKQAETLIKKYHHLVISNNDTMGSEQCHIEMPVSVSFGDISILPEEFRSKKAASIWEKAYAAQLIDEKFQFKGKMIELALFASSLSLALFGKIDWQKIQKWNGYKYYTQKYNLISSKQTGDMTERELTIYKLFN